MRADELFAKATARGIDLKAVAGAASNLDGIAGPRKLTRAERRQRWEDHLGMDVLATASGSESRIYRRPVYTHAEVGQSGCGCPRMPWLAASYSFAGDSTDYMELHRGLTHEAIKFAGRETWPWRIRKLGGGKSFYLEELSQLVLDVEGYKAVFLKAPTMYAVCMDVSEDLWNSALMPKYMMLYGKYERWLGIAQGQLARWLRSEEESDREDFHEGEFVFDSTNPAPYRAANAA